MKKILFILIALYCVSSLAFAEDTTTLAAAANATVGVLIAGPADETAPAITLAAAPADEAAPAITLAAAPADEAAPAVTLAVAPADEAAPVVAPETLTIKGDVIDNMCAGANKDTLAEFVKTHTKECATKPDCMDSGYSFFAEGKLYAFDMDSSDKVAEFLKTADSKLQVTVTVKQVGDELSLVSIENQG